MRDLPDSEIPVGAETHVSIASYNIHRCFVVGGRYRPRRILAVLRELEADIIGLQEVDTRLAVGCRNQLQYLAEELGYTVVAGPNIVDDKGTYGNALLTRWPTLAIRKHDFTHPGREPRGAIDVDLMLKGKRMRIVVTHFGLNAAERRAQGSLLLNALDTDTTTPVVVLGDFNEWWPYGPLSRLLRDRLNMTSSPRTFPSPWPVLSLDRIWGSGVKEIAPPRAHNSRTARFASDHLPVRVVVAP